MKKRYYNLEGLQLKVSPFNFGGGELLTSINVRTDSIGAKQKRSGYISYLGTPDNAQVNSLFSWRQNDDTTFHTYRYSGSVLYYSTGGTGAWTVCGNGTMTNGAHIGYAILDNTMIIGDGTAATRHTTSGTSFTNTSGAPLAEHFEEFQGRIWAARGTAVSGTNTDMFYSTTGTASDWTTDSSSIRIPGAGRINSLRKIADRLVPTKDGGAMFRYDGFNLEDMSTNMGPTSAYAIGDIQGFKIYPNRRGFWGYGGGRPEIISNSVERQIFNSAGSGIIGTTFSNMPGVVYRYDYLASVGTITDDLTDKTIPDAIMRYDFQLAQWDNYQFAHRPTSFHAYRDLNGVDQLIFGDASGQCYQLSGTALTDAGSTINVQMMGMVDFESPESDKEWNYIWAFTNPGAQASMQVATADTFTKQKLVWYDLKQTTDGVSEMKFPAGSRGKLLFWRVNEASRQTRFQFYGFTVDADIVDRK